MKCPYNPSKHCACLEHKDPKAFACTNCPVYRKAVMQKDEPIEGLKALGCLFVGVCMLVIFFLAANQLIKNLHHENTPSEFVVVH